MAETSDTVALLKANPGSNQPYSVVERSMRDHFNSVFFHISADCNGMDITCDILQ
jgi:hypothetical protein